MILRRDEDKAEDAAAMLVILWQWMNSMGSAMGQRKLIYKNYARALFELGLDA